MATFQQRGERVRVFIRRKGHPGKSKTFATKREARLWADLEEGKISVVRGMEEVYQEFHRVMKLVEHPFLKSKGEEIEDQILDFIAIAKEEI